MNGFVSGADITFIDNQIQAPNVSELGPSMERRTLMSNVQPAPLSYEDLANQVLLLLGNFLE